MRRLTMTIAAVAAATAFSAAPAGAAEEQPPCDPGPCIKDVLLEKVRDATLPTTDDVIWTVKCVGDALGGASCHQ
jgi:hypothetical protein